MRRDAPRHCLQFLKCYLSPRRKARDGLQFGGRVNALTSESQLIDQHAGRSCAGCGRSRAFLDTNLGYVFLRRRRRLELPELSTGARDLLGQQALAERHHRQWQEFGSKFHYRSP